MPSFYDERDALWESIPAVEFLTFDEKNEVDYIYTQLLDDVEFYHMAPQDSPHWQELKDFFGIERDGDMWSWDDFKEWYNSV